jgi:hypothetical protein
MASSQPENRVAVSATKLLIKSMISVVLCVGSVGCAQAQDALPNNTNESWTATTQTSRDNVNPSRTTESHAKYGNRSVDKRSVEVLGPDGRYEPYYDTETETIQVNATTTRTVVRTYSQDANGQRNLVQVTEEEARSSASGDAQVVRTTSKPDVNGKFRVVQREVADTKKISRDAQETKTTVYLADGNGGLTPSLQTQELQKGSADHRVEVKKTTLLPDANGNWEVDEVKESTSKEDGKNRTSEERVLRPDFEGRLSEFSRSVTKETETATGEKSNTIERYSMDVPGLTRDGNLHLNQRVTTVQKKDSGGETTEQQVEQPNPGDPTAGLKITTKTIDVLRFGASGTQQTKTIQVRDVNGTFNVVSVETRKSDQVPAAQVQTAPSDKPK